MSPSDGNEDGTTEGHFDGTSLSTAVGEASSPPTVSTDGNEDGNTEGHFDGD